MKKLAFGALLVLLSTAVVVGQDAKANPVAKPQYASPVQPAVPILVGSGAVSGITGIVLTVDGIYKKVALDKAIAYYQAGVGVVGAAELAARASDRDTKTTEFGVTIGVGLGLTVLGGVLVLLGFSQGNGDMDYERVAPPEKTVVKPTVGADFVGIQIIPAL